MCRHREPGEVVTIDLTLLLIPGLCLLGRFRQMIGASSAESGFDQVSNGIWRMDMVKCPITTPAQNTELPLLCDSDDICYAMHP